VSIDRAREIVAEIPPHVRRVAVFHYPTVQQVQAVLDRVSFDVVQAEFNPELRTAVNGQTEFLPVFHDHQDVVQEVARKVRGHGPILLEPGGVGGRGCVPSWERAARLARLVPLVLAGGLHPGNVRRAIALVRPHAVDVCSGVESAPGHKAPGLIAAFLKEVSRC
jgi:phosphoribosylanthranilate isomerase